MASHHSPFPSTCSHRRFPPIATPGTPSPAPTEKCGRIGAAWHIGSHDMPPFAATHGIGTLPTFMPNDITYCYPKVHHRCPPAAKLTPCAVL